MPKFQPPPTALNSRSILRVDNLSIYNVSDGEQVFNDLVIL
jgi:hypothetical protein